LYAKLLELRSSIQKVSGNPEHLFEEMAIANELHAMVSAFYDSAGHSAVKFRVIVDS